MSGYNQQMVEMVNTILHDKFEVETSALKPEAHLRDDLKLDSLDFVDMFVLLEQKTGGAAKNIDFLKIQTLGDIYQLVTDLTNGQNANA